MIHLLKSYISAHSSNKPMQSAALLARSTVLALGMAAVLLVLTGLIYVIVTSI